MAARAPQRKVAVAVRSYCLDQGDVGGLTKPLGGSPLAAENSTILKSTKSLGWTIARWQETTNRRSSPRRRQQSFYACRCLQCSAKPKAGRLPGRRVGKEWRFSRTMLREWVASGPDRHDLELYDRKERADPEHGLDEEEQPGA